MNMYLILAIISPLIFALMNVYDKYFIEKRMKNLYSYWFFVGVVYLLYVGIIALFLKWDSITLTDMILPVIIGILLFFQGYFYLHILEKEDISPITGLYYTYPVIVAFLGYIFLKEALLWYGYLGIGLMIIGALLITLRLKKLSFKIKMWYIIVFTFLVALEEFSMRVAVQTIPE